METVEYGHPRINPPRMTATADWPSVSIIMPVFNEEPFMARSLAGALAQDYPSDKMEILIADGMSTDGTRDIVKRIQTDKPAVRLIDNPQRIVSTGMNQAIASARGEIIVRLDGHCDYPPDYVRRVVKLLNETAADNVGGVLEPVGTSYAQRAVAAAYYSPVSFAGAALKGANSATLIREVDAVHGGCWRRHRLIEEGGFDESMVRNQDDELSFRFRKRGGRVVQSPAIRVKYHVRSSFKKLLLQFLQYGYWKVEVIRRHPQQAGLRHFVPAVFVSTLLGTALISLFTSKGWWALAGIVAGYVMIVSISSFYQFSREKKNGWPGVILAVASMHIGYGLGFILGVLRTMSRLLPGSIFERSTR